VRSPPSIPLRFIAATSSGLRLLTAELTAVTGEAPFFVAPLMVDRQVIGLIYTDRLPSGRAMDEESFSSFNHFCQQAMVVLGHYGQRGG
jgi:hypothetical protein